MKYQISEAAYNDLNNIWFYTFEKWSENQANAYFESLIEHIEIISNNPKAGKNLPKIRKDFFCERALSHYIFFKKEKDIIVVIRILHKMMEFSQHLE